MYVAARGCTRAGRLVNYRRIFKSELKPAAASKLVPPEGGCGIGGPSNPLNVFVRLPRTQLSERDTALCEPILDSMKAAAYILKRNGIEVRFVTGTTVVSRDEQLSRMSKGDGAIAFRDKRLAALEKAHVMLQLYSDDSLSVSGGVERGYYYALLNMGSELGPCMTKNILEQLGRPMQPMQGGCFLTVYMGGKGPDSSLYKLHPAKEQEVIVIDRGDGSIATAEEIDKTLPNADISTMCDLTGVFVSKFIRIAQKLETRYDCDSCLRPTP